jgi:solute:Na+ symporter, SSS family
VLVFFFIVPLFGVVILGMLWKRATPAGGFCGFFAAIVLSICMWVYVHSFPGGYSPPPKLVIDKGAVVSFEKTAENGVEKITRIVVESGAVQATNICIDLGENKTSANSGDLTVKDQDILLPPTCQVNDKTIAVGILAPEVVQAQTKETAKFGVEGVPVVLKPGVKIHAASVVQYFAPAQFNPAHTKYIARSEKAKPMAVNMYSAFWTLLACLGVCIGVSLFTKPKSDAELKDLVYGLTPLPDEGRCPWYKHPALWASVVGIVLVAINIIFW